MSVMIMMIIKQWMSRKISLPNKKLCFCNSYINNNKSKFMLSSEDYNTLYANKEIKI